jgi:hypothetical protein
VLGAASRSVSYGVMAGHAFYLHLQLIKLTSE